MDIRQWPHWGNYLSQIGWKIETINHRQIFVRPIPFLPWSVIKIQRPQNPLPFSEIDKVAQKYRALFVIIEPDITDYQPEELQKHDFSPSKMSFAHTATIFINIDQPENSLWKSFSENAQRNIKKAQKNNLQIKIINLEETIDDTEFRKFFQLLVNLTRLKKFYIPPYDEFYKKMLSLKNNSSLLFAFHKDSPLPIAAVWLGHFKNTAVYMQTGITDEGYQFLANYLLVWEALKLAQKLNCTLFDFEGIYDPRFPKERKRWINFSEFKKRFHGKLIEYPRPWIKIYSRWFKLFYLLSAKMGI